MAKHVEPQLRQHDKEIKDLEKTKLTLSQERMHLRKVKSEYDSKRYELQKKLVNFKDAFAARVDALVESLSKSRGTTGAAFKSQLAANQDLLRREMAAKRDMALGDTVIDMSSIPDKLRERYEQSLKELEALLEPVEAALSDANRTMGQVNESLQAMREQQTTVRDQGVRIDTLLLLLDQIGIDLAKKERDLDANAPIASRSGRAALQAALKMSSRALVDLAGPDGSLSDPKYEEAQNAVMHTMERAAEVRARSVAPATWPRSAALSLCACARCTPRLVCLHSSIARPRPARRGASSRRPRSSSCRRSTCARRRGRSCWTRPS